ncbi:glycosyltransferase [Beggiatoa leptomitoformis]|uniref:Glycosyltransferase n=1 Tax=Beggiatoa leptomitoformis TaxID=288004 RepID=A0A2N9YEN8_9GAMM|nr:glycosyltransferase [Beggiatoa leptomitoformis]ALG68688.1 glycosyltransferase [Beggiatoa leptomitoformis]AUI68958.1 glycosyltransferase [Beggiatoa leptomitoformis]
MTTRKPRTILLLTRYAIPDPTIPLEKTVYAWQLAQQIAQHGFQVIWASNTHSTTPQTTIQYCYCPTAQALQTLLANTPVDVVLLENQKFNDWLPTDFSQPIVTHLLTPANQFFFSLFAESPVTTHQADTQKTISLTQLFDPLGTAFLDGELFDYQKIALDGLLAATDVRDKTILEIGADNANVLYQLQLAGMKQGVGINNWYWKNKAEKQNITDKIVLCHGDIRALPFEDASFDLIFNIAAFEHIHDFPTALREMTRLLKPNGMIYGYFGPLWSSAIGHHLWFTYNRHWMRFTDPDSYAHILRPYEHLRFTKDELFDKLAKQWGEKFATEFVYQIYDNPHINRYTYADYLTFFQQSALVLRLCNNVGTTPIDADVKQQLIQQLPNGQQIDFTCSTLEVLLQKPAHQATTHPMSDLTPTTLSTAIPSTQNRKVFLITHGMFPVAGESVTGNGIRAWGLAMGLRQQGFEVIYATQANTIRTVPENALVTLVPYQDYAHLHSLIKTYQPAVLIVGYWEIMRQLPDNFEIPIVLDLLAPRLLEAEFQDQHNVELELIDYIYTLSRADHFLCCTKRQKGFHLSWLLMSGISCKDNPLDLIPISASPQLPQRPIQPPEHQPTFVYGGVIWPWRDPSAWMLMIMQTLDAHARGKLHLVVGKYPLAGGEAVSLKLPDEDRYQHILHKSDLMPYNEMEQFYLQADIGIELGTKNCERELSFSFRVIDYLRCGLPVICNDFLEVADLIREYDAGWVIPSDDNDALTTVVARIVTGKENLAQKSANAQRLILEQFNWEKTTQPLVNFCLNPHKLAKRSHFFMALAKRFNHEQDAQLLQEELNKTKEKLSAEQQLSAQITEAKEQGWAECNRLKADIDNLQHLQAATAQQVTIWQNIAEQRRLKSRLTHIGQSVKTAYRAVVKRFFTPLVNRITNRKQKHLAIITRHDVFPVDHGAAAKIYHTARALSYHYDEVYLITAEREKFYIFHNGIMQEELYPRLLRRLWAIPETNLRQTLHQKYGIPLDDAFLFFPLLDNNFRLRVLYVALQKKINVYQAEFPAYLSACRWAHLLFRGQTSIVEHNVEFARIAKTYNVSKATEQFMAETEIRLCRAADNVIVVSQADLERLVQAGVNIAKLTLIPHGVDLKMFTHPFPSAETIRQRYGISADDMVLVFHGIYAYPPNRQAVELIDTVILPALNQRGYYPKCLAVGKYPPKHKNHPDLYFTDVVEHVAPYLKAADIAIVPLQDGGGTRMKILEYFASSIPVIATAKGAEGIPVINGQTALIEDEINAFVEAIIRLMTDTPLRQRLGAAGRQFVEQYDWQAIAEHYWQVYEGQ